MASLHLLAAVTARAQASAFPARAELVVVDVVVTDAHGRPIAGLRREDFVVEEDGVLQDIVEFEAVDVASGAAATGAPAPSPIATNERPAAPARTFLVVFDDLSLTSDSAETARRALQKFLAVHLRENDCLTLAPTAGGAWWTGCGSSDRDDLEAVLRALRGRRQPDRSNERMSDYEAMRIEADNDAEAAQHVALRWAAYGVPMGAASGPEGTEGGLDGASAGTSRSEGTEGDLHSASYPWVRTIAAEVYSRVRQRSEAVLSRLERAMESLAGGRSRRVVILASDGFVHDHRLPGLQRVREVARRSNAALYFLDPRALVDPAIRGPDMPSLPDPDSLFRYAALAREYAGEEAVGAEALAADTGGFTVRGSELAAGLGRIVAESRIFYLLAYAPPDSRKEGRFRKIKVKVRRPDVRVRARKGYFPGSAPSEKETAGGPPPEVRRALDAPDVDREVPLRMMAYVLGNAAEGRATVLLSAEADPGSVTLREKDGRLLGTVGSFSTVSARDSGQVGRKELVHALDVRPEAMRAMQTTWLPVTHVYQLPPGRYQARLAVTDQASGRIGSVRQVFDVPGLQALRLTTPVLTDALAPGGGAEKSARPLPVARRTFGAGSRLVCEVEAWGGGASVVEVVHEVRRADGTVVARTDPRPLAPDARGARPSRFEMTLHRAGEYELRLIARDRASGEEALAVERFSVVAAR